MKPLFICGKLEKKGWRKEKMWLLLILIFGIGFFLNYFLAGLYQVSVQEMQGDTQYKWFLGLGSFITLTLSALLVMLIALGGAFSTPKGENLINWYSLMILTGLQIGLLGVCLLEAWRRKTALWGKYILVLLATAGVFFSILIGITGYTFLAVILVAWFAQLFYFRSETKKQMSGWASTD